MSTFKTRQCKQLMETMFCPYGARCQYMHNAWSAEHQREMPYVKVLEESETHVRARLDVLEGPDVPIELSEHLYYISAYYK